MISEEQLQAKLAAYREAQSKYEAKLKEVEMQLYKLQGERESLEKEMQELFGTTDTNQALTTIEGLEQELTVLEQELAKITNREKE